MFKAVIVLDHMQEVTKMSCLGGKKPTVVWVQNHLG